MWPSSRGSGMSSPLQIPHWGPPTHAMEIFRYAEQGSIEFLWVSGTNPAVSLPELHRIRSILSRDELFVVVSDAFLTETARLADVVFPVALWGEKTGTFTNTDRTVHLSEQAVEPPGNARPDMQIFIDYAQRLGLRDKDGEPLVKWSRPEECFEAWKECTRGRPCDYTGLSYEKLRGGSGIQWPCNDAAPDGTERLYENLSFPTFPELCEDFGHDILDRGVVLGGRVHGARRARSRDPEGGRLVAAARVGRQEYPFTLTTGRTVYHFHTRTKTGRAQSSKRPLRTPGSSSAQPTPNVSISPRAIGCAYLRLAARSSSLRESADPGGSRVHAVPLRLLGHRR